MKKYYIIGKDTAGTNILVTTKVFDEYDSAYAYKKTVASSWMPEIVETTDLGDITCHDLGVLSRFINKHLYLNLLGAIDDDGMAPIANQHVMLALQHISMAVTEFRIADLHQMKGE